MPHRGSSVVRWASWWSVSAAVELPSYDSKRVGGAGAEHRRQMTVINWPKSLLAEVAERRCVIVLSAGASASSVNKDGVSPPDWLSFINAGIARMGRTDDQNAARSLLDHGAALDAAQVVADSLGAADFSLFIRDEFEKPGFEPSELHQLILAIDPKVVITTNYDTILESLARSGAGVAGP